VPPVNHPVVSVVIPAYNQARFLGEAIRTVLTQTYPHYEIIVVNDASQDDTDSVVRQFDDPRLRCITHDRNRGLSEARNTGIRAARGDLVAFLDGDDLFHPDKLGAHVGFLEARREVDASYNARMELNHSASTVREIWWPPPTVGLRDLVLGFPFAPSDLVARRQRLLEVGLFDARMGSAEDTDLPCRLALAGCRFARVDHVLNSRRFHSGRRRGNLAGRRDDIKRALAAVFADPRCPVDVKAMQKMALTPHLLPLVSLALIQGETRLAHQFLEELVSQDPSVVKGRPCELESFLMMASIADDGADHEALLHRVFSQFPASLARLSDRLEWAIGRGFLWKGLRAALWDRVEDARVFLSLAVERQARIDRKFLHFVASHILNYERAFGGDASQEALDRVANGLRQAATPRHVRQLTGFYLIDRAFNDFRAGELSDVPRTVSRAIANRPVYLANPGVVAMLIRSVGRAGRQPAKRAAV